MRAGQELQELVLVLLEPPAGLPWGPGIFFFKFIYIYLDICGHWDYSLAGQQTLF